MLIRMIKRCIDHRFLLALLLTALIWSCGTAESERVRDRKWALEYLRDLGNEHYGMALCAAARCQMISGVDESRDGKSKEYDFKKISQARAVESIKLLIKRSVDIDTKAGGKTPLMLAVMDGYPEIVRTLLRLGANPLIIDTTGKNAADYARESDNESIQKLVANVMEGIANAYYEISDPHQRSAMLPDTTRSARQLQDTHAKADSTAVDSLKGLDNPAFHLAGSTQQRTGTGRKLNLGGSSNFQNYDLAPQIITQVKPVYPEKAIQEGIQGSVRLEVEVLPNGQVGGVKILRSVQAGAGGIDEAAIAAIKKSKFQPAMKAGFPVQTKMELTLHFKL